MKKVEFNKAAYTAYTTLSDVDKVKADKLINAFAEEDKASNPLLTHNIRKVSGGSEGNLYSLRLGPKFRILVEVREDQVIVVDILNHDLFVKYFRTVQAA